jgi:hypothetical protein
MKPRIDFTYDSRLRILSNIDSYGIFNDMELLPYHRCTTVACEKGKPAIYNSNYNEPYMVLYWISVCFMRFYEN